MVAVTSSSLGSSRRAVFIGVAAPNLDSSSTFVVRPEQCSLRRVVSHCQARRSDAAVGDFVVTILSGVLSMANSRKTRFVIGVSAFVTIAALGAGFVAHADTRLEMPQPDAMGPVDQSTPLPKKLGNVVTGRDVFRFETFGNEGFWTDAVRLPEGIIAAKLTPMQALQLGLQVDADAIDAQTKAQLGAELSADPSGRSSKLLNDPNVTLALIKANAVIGMSAKGAKVGVSCALCHTMTDASVFKSPKGGSIGSRIDGVANHVLNTGAIFAAAANTRALYTVAQTQLTANKGKTLGRAPRGLTEKSTEAQFDAYFSNPRYYPVGTFDDTFDGNGDPMHNSPLFRQDLAAPYGSEGLITKLDDFSNLVYTTLFDQTMLTTPGGRAFVHKLAGAAGDEMIDDYVKILSDTGVTGYPYVTARSGGAAGTLPTPIGFRVDNSRLLALNAYLAALPAPAGSGGDPAAAARGAMLFATSGCTGCHNVSQSRPVPTTIHPMALIWPGDHPKILAARTPPLSPVQDTPGNFFDDKMAVVNASIRGEKRGIAMPLLLDLGRKPVFLHDNSVPTLDTLFNPSRGRSAPHPYYLANGRQRADVAEYLRSLDTTSH
jgi:cytochrome c2